MAGSGTLDAPILGTSGRVVLMIGGMIGLIILVNRRCPRRPGEQAAVAFGAVAGFVSSTRSRDSFRAATGHLSIMSRTRFARASIANGLVTTCMPGSRWPLPTTAFSA